MTVKKPRQIILVNAPSSVHQLIQHETETEPIWRKDPLYVEFWDRREGSSGKVAFIKILRCGILPVRKPRN